MTDDDARRLSSHPHFNDGGAVRWHTRFSEAVEAATREGKHILVEFGRYA